MPSDPGAYDLGRNEPEIEWVVVPCSYEECGGRRRHHEDDTPRGRQMVRIPKNLEGDYRAFCSIECAVYAGELKLK